MFITEKKLRLYEFKNNLFEQRFLNWLKFDYQNRKQPAYISQLYSYTAY